MSAHSSQTEYLRVRLKVKGVGQGVDLWPQQLTGNFLWHSVYQLASQAPSPDVSGLWTHIPFMRLVQWLSVSLGLPSYILARDMLGKCQDNDRVHTLWSLLPFHVNWKASTIYNVSGDTASTVAGWLLFIVCKLWALRTHSLNIF